MKSPHVRIFSVRARFRKHTAPNPFGRWGAAMIEVLTAMSVMGVACAITVPALVWTREVSRRNQCLSNLKQIGVAIDAFQSAHKIFPPGSDGGYSPHVSILPQIDQAPLQETIKKNQANSTENEGLKSLVPLYLCPSDYAADLREQGGWVATNYVGNFGTGVQRHGYNGVFCHSKGRGKHEERPLAPRDIKDGLSQTAMMSEVLSGDGSGHRLRTHWHTDRRLDDPKQLDEFAKYCKNWTPKQFLPGGVWHGDGVLRGRPWTWGDPGYTWYNHVLTPNQLSCFNKDLVQEGIFTAGSLHFGGVNLLFADGQAIFISNNIDSQIWTDLGSRDGE
jgi:type II secretory pathway pseudopilin PulG